MLTTIGTIGTAAPTNNLGDGAFTGGRLFDGLFDTGTRVIEHYSDAIAVPIFILDPL